MLKPKSIRFIAAAISAAVIISLLVLSFSSFFDFKITSDPLLADASQESGVSDKSDGLLNASELYGSLTVRSVKSSVIASPISHVYNGKNLTAKVSGTSVKLSWTASKAKNKSYYIKYRLSSSSKWIKAGTSKTTSYTVKNLTKGETYDFWVYNVYDDTDLKASDENKTTVTIGANQNTDSSKSSETVGKTNLKAKPSGNSVLLTWSESTAKKKMYKVLYKSSKSTSWKSAAETDKTSFTVENLESGETYDFWVYNIYDAAGAYLESSNKASATIEKSSSAQKSDPDPDDDFDIDNTEFGHSGADMVLTIDISSTTAKLSWTKISGVKKYKIFNICREDGEWVEKHTITSATSLTMKDLEIGKMYDVWVESEDGEHFSNGITFIFDGIKSKIFSDEPSTVYDSEISDVTEGSKDTEDTEDNNAGKVEDKSDDNDSKSGEDIVIISGTSKESSKTSKSSDVSLPDPIVFLHDKVGYETSESAGITFPFKKSDDLKAIQEYIKLIEDKYPFKLKDTYVVEGKDWKNTSYIFEYTGSKKIGQVSLRKQTKKYILNTPYYDSEIVNVDLYISVNEFYSMNSYSFTINFCDDDVEFVDNKEKSKYSDFSPEYKPGEFKTDSGSSSGSSSKSKTNSAETGRYKCTNIKCSSGYVKCTRCDGKGKLEEYYSTPNYSGKQKTSSVKMVNCPKCNGTGKLKCQTCGGDGWCND